MGGAAQLENFPTQILGGNKIFIQEMVLLYGNQFSTLSGRRARSPLLRNYLCRKYFSSVRCTLQRTNIINTLSACTYNSSAHSPRGTVNCSLSIYMQRYVIIMRRLVFLLSTFSAESLFGVRTHTIKFNLVPSHRRHKKGLTTYKEYSI
jgi:hypothetical protein